MKFVNLWVFPITLPNSKYITLISGYLALKSKVDHHCIIIYTALLKDNLKIVNCTKNIELNVKLEASINVTV
jgi:hypothetical protein